MELLHIAYIVFTILLVLKIAYRLYKTKIDTILVIDIFMLIFYGFPMCSFTNHNGILTMMVSTPSWVGFLCVVFFYISCLVGQVLIGKSVKYNYYLPHESFFVKRLANAILFLSVALFLMYCTLFGGFKEVMINIYSIRNGIVVSSNRSVDFLPKLYNVVIYAPILLIAFWNKQSTNNRIITKKTILISLVIAFIIKLSSGSRGAMLTLFFIFSLGSILNNRKNVSSIFRRITGGSQVRKYIVMGIVGYFTIVILRPLLFYFNNVYTEGEGYAVEMLQDQLFSSGGRYSMSSWDDLSNSLLRSFQHYGSSMELALDKVNSGGHSNNYFMEFVAMIQSVVPSLLLGIKKISSVTHYNSMYFGVEQNIPPGIIASAIYSGGILWVIFYGFLVGIIGRNIDLFYMRLKKNVHFASYYYVSLLFVFFSFAASGDFASQFSKSFTSLILFLYIYVRLKRKRVLYSRNTNHSTHVHVYTEDAHM